MIKCFVAGGFMLSEKLLIEKYGKDAEIITSTIAELKTLSVFDKKTMAEAEEIAEVVIGLKLDASSVSASLIFLFALKSSSVLEQISVSKETIQILKMLIRCEEVSKHYTDADGLKEMILAITKDIRVVVIKTAQILVFAKNNVQNIDNPEVVTVFQSIDDIYVPISARLGLSEIKSELQDLSFEFHEPKQYFRLKEEVKKETRANTHMINEIVSNITKMLSAHGVECKCYGRIKHLSSIYNKIKNKNLTLKGIYDIAAVRILLKNVSECYLALGIVHSSFNPVDGRFKDYIANPKPNGYQSLHTTVYFKNEFFEVQIRTEDMHEFAEYGVAAHFLYKENKKSLAGIDNKLLMIRRLLENKDNVSSETLLDELKTDVYLGEIFVQTPKGKVIKLVENATPIDFAYAIHSDVGNMCVGAKVNGTMAPLLSTLKNGDVVEILTSQNSKGPSRDWLKHIKMPSTKDKINAFFKKQMKDENIKLGKSMLEQYAKTTDLQLSSLMQEKWVNQILQKHAFVSVDELYASIGYGSFTAEKVVKRLLNMKLAEDKKTRNILDEVAKAPVKIENKSDILGVEGALTKYCKCCNPIPGDEIIGYVSRGRGVIIHRTTCENVAKLSSDRFIKVDWNESQTKDYTFTSIIDLVAKNKATVYTEITNALSELSIRVVSLNTSENRYGELLIKIGVLVKDKNQLQQVKNKLVSLGCVYEAK